VAKPDPKNVTVRLVREGDLPEIVGIDRSVAGMERTECCSAKGED